MALGWLLNLGFAGGEVAHVDTLEQTVAVSYEFDSSNTLCRVPIFWRSDANGNVVRRMDDVDEPRLYGRIVCLHTIPATGGLAPTDNYDVTMSDIHGIDMLQAVGADRDTANEETAWVSDQASTEVPIWPYWLGDLVFRVASAGANTCGTAVLYVQLGEQPWLP